MHGGFTLFCGENSKRMTPFSTFTFESCTFSIFPMKGVRIQPCIVLNSENSIIHILGNTILKLPVEIAMYNGENSCDHLLCQNDVSWNLFNIRDKIILDFDEYDTEKINNVLQILKKAHLFNGGLESSKPIFCCIDECTTIECRPPIGEIPTSLHDSLLRGATYIMEVRSEYRESLIRGFNLIKSVTHAHGPDIFIEEKKDILLHRHITVRKNVNITSTTGTSIILLPQVFIYSGRYPVSITLKNLTIRNLSTKEISSIYFRDVPSSIKFTKPGTGHPPTNISKV